MSDAVRSCLCPLDDLLSPPDGPAVLSGRARRCLRENIEATGWTPALIVRPHPSQTGKFEIVDGAARADILAELGHTHARCEVWPVDDEKACVLRLTLNGIRGRVSPGVRARQLRRVVRRLGADRAAQATGLTAASLRRALAQGRPPTVQPRQAAMDLQPVVFHLPSDRAEQLADALSILSAGGSSRAEALVQAVTSAAGGQPRKQVNR